jgi:hypothetical protein
MTFLHPFVRIRNYERSRDFLRNLTVAQQVKKFRRVMILKLFATMYTRILHWILP